MKSLSRFGALVALTLTSCACTNGQPPVKAAVADAPPPPPSAPPADVTTPPPPADAAKADAAPPAPPAGQDFIEQAKTLMRLAACGGDTPVPARFDAKLVEAHCKDLTAKYAEYRKQWVDIAVPYIAKLEPVGLPSEIVYPFGGGDAMSALATFPDAGVYTTISLEVSGDIRKVDTITQKKLDAELALNRLHLGKLFEKIHSRTVNLDIEAKSDLPGEIVFTLVALAIYGYEPVSLRYFTLEPAGTLHYLSADDIASMEKAELAKHKSVADIQGDVFGNIELQFRKAGDAGGPVKTLRHIAANLDDKHMKADPSLLKHLEAKGKVAAMTKAASHCLWSDQFSMIRQYLEGHIVWMISDSTGIPPRFASKAGFVQDTYGVFDWPAAFFVDVASVESNNKNSEDMVKLWKQNPQHDMPFRYGYPDRDHHGHMMVTRPASSPAP
jgi:hypothetical protein